MWFFIAAGIVWLTLVLFAVCLCIVAGRADERQGNK
jgi:hypothetical protein